jgi:putative ABC transport system permease protein
MSSFWADISYACRSLGRAKGFTVFAVLILALGISVTTAGSSLLYRIVLRPLPFPEPDRLVVLGHRSPADLDEELLMTPALYTYYTAESRSLADIALFRYRTTYLTGGPGIARGVSFAETTPELAIVLRARPVLGRWIDEEDVRSGRAVVVLSHELWANEYGADPSIVGRTIELSSEPHQVVGVMDGGFSFPARADVWVPYAVRGVDPFSAADPLGAFRFFGVARVAPGSTLEDVRTELAALLPRVDAVFPGEFGRFVVEQARLTPTVEPLETWNVRAVERTLWLLFAASAIILLIACTNVANLLIVRAEARRRSMAVRMALGAGRLRLLRLSLAEGLVVALAGGALGCLSSLLVVSVVQRFVPDEVMSTVFVARGPEAGMHPWIIGFALAASLTTALAFSVVPFLRPIAAADELKQGFSGVGPSPSRARAMRVLVGAEVALTLVLLAAGSLTVRSVLALNAIVWGSLPRTSSSSGSSPA